jgi:hypothetical protein
MYSKYPNLELIEYKFRQLYAKWTKENDIENAKPPEIELFVWPQTFPNTAGIFDKGGFSGQAFITMYITVCHDMIEDVYAVFGGSDFAYMVSEPTKKFFKDLKEHNLLPVSEANAMY